MERSVKALLLERRIMLLRKKLEEVIMKYPINSANVLELSRELDSLIVGYYNIKDFNIS
ncbi:MAG TPA: aspartyl-phosphate phosphatase Spo0E family protein [Clostridiaceae bacterium]|nr:aspartyl-phosphate phosphatase Spo0E family protein [Clostridiaceae bacterium]